MHFPAIPAQGRFSSESHEEASVDIFSFTYMKYVTTTSAASFRFYFDSLQFAVSFVRSLNVCTVEGFYCEDFFQPFLENTFGAVTTWIDAATATDTVVHSASAYCFVVTLRTGITHIIIQQIVTLSKYGHDALDICHP